ncbi:MAG TPA: hypothetical protein VLB86_06480 [Gaiellaceae bacterium]|nr:hypothetical protein [Gaiellaceae bacterium]
MATDARTIAARLGIDELTVRRLQARGHLLRLDASDDEVRERLYRATVRRLRPRRARPAPPDDGLPPAA